MYISHCPVQGPLQRGKAYGTERIVKTEGEKDVISCSTYAVHFYGTENIVLYTDAEMGVKRRKFAVILPCTLPQC